MTHKWVVCTHGKGRLHEDGSPETRITTFPRHSLGLVESQGLDYVVIWLYDGRNARWTVPSDQVAEIDVLQTGDKFSQKICNLCHRLLDVSNFDRNQTNKHGVLRRPSCQSCRTNIDKRAPKSRQAKQKEKERPTKGADFKCPICQKRTIAGVTARVVADHDHDTGNIRDFICDSCNTGLGRFKNGQNCLENALHYLESRSTLG